MKTFRPGLRTQILLSLTLLLVAAMISTSFVVTRIRERDLLQHKVADGKAVVKKMQLAIKELSRGQGPPPLELVRERLRNGATWMAPSRLFGQIIVMGRDGTLWVGNQGPDRSVKTGDPEIASVLRTGKETTRISRNRGILTVTAPLFAGGRCIAAIQVPVRIDRVVHGLIRSQQLIWFYIGLNVFVLLVFGTFLLSRTVIRPIKRLVKTADHFEDLQRFSPATEANHNEIAHLAISLNRMLKRLAENKQQMEAQIRSLKQANEEILRSEKLSSVGRLAAGMAHEVGNPIGAILGYANLLRTHVEKNQEARDFLERIEKEIARIDTIVRELLDFSRPSPGSSVPVDINALVSESASFFSHQKPTRSVEFETRLEENIGMVWANPDQLKQVLINLMLNACDAMEKGGRITIATSQTPWPEAREKSPDKGSAGFVEIAVSDTGKGIPKSKLNDVFDPFYTTKPPGKGTGLGLAISLRIVESFGGAISVESVEGKGSTFKIRLPLERRV